MSSPLVALLEALPRELDLLLPPFLAEDLEDAFERAFEAVLRDALPAFDAAFLVLLLAFAFAFDPDFAARAFELDDFDFDPALDFALPLVDLPDAFFSAI